MENGLAVPGVVGALKERAVYRLQEEIRSNALRLSKDEGFAHRLHHRGDHEIAAQFEGMRSPWLVGDDGHPRLAASSRGRTRSTASVFPRRLSIACPVREGPAEYRRGDKVLPKLLVRFPQQPGKLTLMVESET